MKSQLFWKWTLGMSLGVLPLAGGCVKENPAAPTQTASAITAVAEPAVVYAALPAEQPPIEQPPAEVVPAPQAPTVTNLAEAPVEAVKTNQPSPAKVNLTPAAAELVRLANSGVDEAVMLTYVTNSPSTFNLGADEIIYLNDLGVSGPLVTAMIQRDHVLRAAGAAAMAASVQANTPQAVQPLPAAEDVAPQATAPVEQAAETPPPPPEGDVTTSTFYDSLSPYGTWIYVSGSGWCWRPTVTVVNTSWEPYFDGGHWVYTDWGWYWVSDYSWGWAPFHYGRWFHHNHWGWCWAPDTVWGPSWVSWRYGGSYCGWAPLPPGAYFTFGVGLTYHGRPCHDWHEMGIAHGHGHYVAWRDFDRRSYHGHAVPRHQRESAYRDTVVVNNISIDNRTVINRGVPRERVAEATHRDIRPVTVRETTASAGRPVGGRREQLRGNTLTVYRPAISRGADEGRTAGTRGTRSRPELGTRGSAASATSAPSSSSAPLVGDTGFGSARPVTVPSRTRTGMNLEGGNATVTKPAVAPAPALESPAQVSRETRQAPVTRVPGVGSASTPAPVTRPEPSATRSLQTAPSQRSAQPATREPAPQAQSAPALTRPSTPTPRSPAVQTHSPAPTSTGNTPRQSVTAPQRSQAAPAYTPTYTAPQRLSTPSASGQREAVSVPRYAPAQPSYSAPQQQPSSAPRSAAPVTTTPSYSRPAAPAPSTPQAAPPAVSAPRPAPSPQPAPAPQPAAPASRPAGGGRPR